MRPSENCDFECLYLDEMDIKVKTLINISTLCVCV